MAGRHFQEQRQPLFAAGDLGGALERLYVDRLHSRLPPRRLVPCQNELRQILPTAMIVRQGSRMSEEYDIRLIPSSTWRRGSVRQLQLRRDVMEFAMALTERQTKELQRKIDE